RGAGRLPAGGAGPAACLPLPGSTPLTRGTAGALRVTARQGASIHGFRFGGSPGERIVRMSTHRNGGRTMEGTNTIRVRATAARMFALAAQVERWPALLPHYRRVRVLGRRGARTWLDMAARRGPIPVRWQAVQEVYPASQLITYRHVGGVT